MGTFRDTHGLSVQAEPNFHRVARSYGPCLWGIIHLGAGTFSLWSTQTSSGAAVGPPPLSAAIND